MSLDFKALKKLADACRKAGIKHFKNADMEFTLTDDLPESNYKKRKAKSSNTIETKEELIPTETLTDEQLLFYSVLDVEGNSKDESIQ